MVLAEIAETVTIIRDHTLGWSQPQPPGPFLRRVKELQLKKAAWVGVGPLSFAFSTSQLEGWLSGSSTPSLRCQQSKGFLSWGGLENLGANASRDRDRSPLAPQQGLWDLARGTF